MIAVDNLVTITDAKGTLGELVRVAADESRPTVLTKHGRPAAVLLGMADYDALQEEIEDLRDRLSVYESREAGPGGRLSFEKVLVELDIEPSKPSALNRTGA